MKALLLDVAATHINPTANLLPQLLHRAFTSVKYFGPGYVDSATLSAGIRKWFSENGPFDALVIGHGIPVLGEKPLDNLDLENAAKYLREYEATKIPQSILVAFFIDVLTHLRSLDTPLRVITTLNFDFYNASEKVLDRVAENDLLLLGPNFQFTFARESLPERVKHDLPFNKCGAQGSGINYAWFDFLEKNESRVLTAAHFVGENEFIYREISSRPYTICVPGIEYLQRRNGLKNIRQQRMEVAPKLYSKVLRMADKIGMPVFSSFLGIKLYNTLFLNEMVSSKYAYTDGSAFAMMIRKYVEIPASGTLLICKPCNGFRDFGFEVNSNCIEADPDNLGDAVEYLEALPESEIFQIARNGQQMVLENHSLNARASQIRQMMQRLLEGKYTGARWAKGSFVLNDERSKHEA